MLQTTNNIKQFFEDEKGSIIVYGYGDFGRWIGSFMKCCHMACEMYIDKWWGEKGIIGVEGAPVCHIKELNRFKNVRVRIIIASIHYKEILADLHTFDLEEGYDILCLLPLYNIEVELEYDINRLLGYFRRKLINEDVPTIISADCIAARLYTSLGYEEDVVNSPTIKNPILADDFLKVALNPEHYLNIEMKARGIQGGWHTPYPAGILDDVTVYFAHRFDYDVQKYVDEWNSRKNNINWQRLIFVIRERGALPYDFVERMRECRYPYYIIRTTSFNAKDMDEHCIYDPAMLDLRTTVIENHFDLIGWYNSLGM